MMRLPAPADAVQLARVLDNHPRWSLFWDKKYGVWRAAEDDPDSALYAESRDLDTVLGYITAHSLPLPSLRVLAARPVLAGRQSAASWGGRPAPGGRRGFGNSQDAERAAVRVPAARRRHSVPADGQALSSARIRACP